MQGTKSQSVEEGIAAHLWIKGASHEVRLVWVSQSHFELVLDPQLDLSDDQLVALVVHGFLSLPARVEIACEGFAVMRFVQRPHHTVIELIGRDLLENCISAAQVAGGTGDLPGGSIADLAMLLEGIDGLQSDDDRLLEDCERERACARRWKVA